MPDRCDRDYASRHERVVQKLMEMVEEKGCACFPVSKLAAELGMDQRTVRNHLKIIEIDNAGVFMDPDDKQFCTKEGVALLAKRLGMIGMITGEPAAEQDAV